jgi:hypothetical protein
MKIRKNGENFSSFLRVKQTITRILVRGNEPKGARVREEGDARSSSKPCDCKAYRGILRAHCG